MLRMPDRLVAGVFEPLWDLYEGSNRLRELRVLERSQWWDRDRLEEARARRLRALVNHASATSPFYAERFAQAGIDPQRVRTLADLAGLPVLTKADLRGELSRILSSAYRQEDLVSAKTGGSTGEALHVFCDKLAAHTRGGAALRANLWSGWRLGQPTAAVWGNPPVARTLKSRLRGGLTNRAFYLDTMRIDAAAIDRFVADWRRWRPGMLYGHAHSLYILAEALRDRGSALRPCGIVATSMMLIRPEREAIEAVFGVPVTDRYGCEEVSLIASECEEHRGLHLNAEHAYVEFLRDDGSACTPGEDGRIVVTELLNRGMPTIRYEVGDRGVPSDRCCPCGRTLPLMESLTGRSADFLLATDGSLVAGVSLIERTLTRFAGIRQMQLVQDERGAAVANLVLTEGWSEQVKSELVAELRSHLGTDFRIEVREVARIAQERNGKYRFSICRLRR
jgi:phenylacetate-CoA ligase